MRITEIFQKEREMARKKAKKEEEPQVTMSAEDSKTSHLIDVVDARGAKVWINPRSVNVIRKTMIQGKVILEVEVYGHITRLEFNNEPEADTIINLLRY